LADWSDHYARSMLPVVLLDSARTWHRGKTATHPFATLDEALDALSERFGKGRRIEGDCTTMLNMKQQRGETIDALVARIAEEALAIPGGVPDTIWRTALYNALPYALQTNVKRTRPENFEAAVAAARYEEQMRIDALRSSGGRTEPQAGPQIPRFQQGAQRVGGAAVAPQWRQQGPARPTVPWRGPQQQAPQLSLPPIPRPTQFPPRTQQAPAPTQQYMDARTEKQQLRDLARVNVPEARRQAMMRGVCMNCFDRGHIARNCPQERTNMINTSEESGSEWSEPNNGELNHQDYVRFRRGTRHEEKRQKAEQDSMQQESSGEESNRISLYTQNYYESPDEIEEKKEIAEAQYYARFQEQFLEAEQAQHYENEQPEIIFDLPPEQHQRRQARGQDPEWGA
jgi:hypothetical protein